MTHNVGIRDVSRRETAASGRLDTLMMKEDATGFCLQLDNVLLHS